MMPQALTSGPMKPNDLPPMKRPPKPPTSETTATKNPGKSGELVEIYELIDPRDQSVRYIGKANNSQDRLKSHLRDDRRRDTPVYRWIRKLASMGLTPQIKVVSLIPNDEWNHEEKRIIFEARLTHPKILNVADGGNEPFCSIETRRENGRLLAHSKNRVIHKLLRQFGHGIRYFTSIGNIESLQLQIKAQQRLRRLNQEQMESFAEEWIKSHPGYV